MKSDEWPAGLLVLCEVVIRLLHHGATQNGLRPS